MKRDPMIPALRLVAVLVVCLIAFGGWAVADEEPAPVALRVCAQQVQADALELLSLRIATTEQQQRAERAERAMLGLRQQLAAIVAAAEGVELPEALQEAIDNAALVAAPREE